MSFRSEKTYFTVGIRMFQELGGSFQLWAFAEDIITAIILAEAQPVGCWVLRLRTEF